MRVLVTGGAGYIGSHTTLALQEAGHDVLVVDDLSNSSQESLNRVGALSGREPRFVRANVRDAAALDAAFSAFSPEAVIHFAGWKAVGESTQIPLTYYRENLGSTFMLLETMAAHQCKRGGEAARAGDVVGGEVEIALRHGGHPVRGWRQCDQPCGGCPGRQACGCAPRGGLPGEGAGARRVTRGAT